MATMLQEYMEIPGDKLEITDTSEKDVTRYGKAQIVDANLIAANIAKDVVVLGITGTHLTPSGTITTTPNILSQSVDVTQYTTNEVKSIYEEVSTAAGMDAVNVDANIGKMYKYTGTTTSNWRNDSLYIITELSRVGGRIFYDAGDNGVTYTFYDSSMNIITDTSITGLANAYYYTVDSTPTNDRWYVYDNTSHTHTLEYHALNVVNGLLSGSCWGYVEGAQTGNNTTNTVGAGKTNTANIFAITDPSAYTSIWKYIKEINRICLNGCSDWFIGSEAEQDQLRTSGLVSWYTTDNIWSSHETGSDTYSWDYSSSAWTTRGRKIWDTDCCAMRSF